MAPKKAQYKKTTWFCALDALEPLTYMHVESALNKNILGKHKLDKKHICDTCYEMVKHGLIDVNMYNYTLYWIDGNLPENI